MPDIALPTANPPRRVATGVKGLDAILGGGLPQEQVYLLEGSTGTGKTTIGLQFLLEGARQGERSLFIILPRLHRCGDESSVEPAQRC